MSIIAAGILLFLVMDPFGNITVFLTVLKTVPQKRRQKVIIRELLIALMILIVFLFVGPVFLNLMQISQHSLHIAGGIILFLIAIKMIFGQTEELFKGNSEEDPLIVPLAVPSIAGPSAVATVLLLVGQDEGRKFEWLLSLFLAWLGTGVILLLSAKLARLLGKRALNAVERLMGLILTAISVEMFLQGILAVIRSQD